MPNLVDVKITVLKDNDPLAEYRYMLTISTGHRHGHIEFTWQQVMVGIQSSIIMFPINLLIVSIFRNTRPREKTAKAEGLKQGNTVKVSPSQTTSPHKEIKHITPDTVIKLGHVEKALCLLGPSRFPNTSSYNRAMQQVQGIKSHLESLLNGDQVNRSPSPEDSISSSAEKKRCQGGLPWWFVFVGWILVIATSTVSGYFTMMYGLTYGKDQSINWLISMVVSFFESLFITQPLKVGSNMQGTLNQMVSKSFLNI
ncbi:hypothetical protein GOODEAATRI_014066 [Goodea atripinnis]|uniref:Uncharacterized protein n=1 Tax=Goodea atripinnis TaxID=208336 RepID=A0ABV0N1C3_9TELE